MAAAASNPKKQTVMGSLNISGSKTAGASSRLFHRLSVSSVIEWMTERLIWMAGVTAILLLVTIMFFLFREAAHTFTHTQNPAYAKASTGSGGLAGTGVTDVPPEINIPFWTGLKLVLLGQHWYPISTPYEFGFLPLLFGSFVVTVLAVLISLPFGIMAAIYIGEVAPVRLRLWLKSAVELIVAIPSVVLGFIGLFVLVPLMQRAFGLQTGLCGITGALTLAFMALPTIVSISEDALASVPKDYREASLAMGSTKWETISKVVVPAASSGIVAALMLGIGRAIGETMAVLMVTGNAAELPKLASQWFYSPPDPSDSQYTLPWVGFMSMRTMPATIGAEMGETVQGDAHYHALFACGALLFVITFLINVIADAALAKARRRGASR